MCAGRGRGELRVTLRGGHPDRPHQGAGGAAAAVRRRARRAGRAAGRGVLLQAPLRIRLKPDVARVRSEAVGPDGPEPGPASASGRGRPGLRRRPRLVRPDPADVHHLSRVLRLRPGETRRRLRREGFVAAVHVHGLAALARAARARSPTSPVPAPEVTVGFHPGEGRPPRVGRPEARRDRGRPDRRAPCGTFRRRLGGRTGRSRRRAASEGRPVRRRRSRGEPGSRGRGCHRDLVTSPRPSRWCSPSAVGTTDGWVCPSAWGRKVAGPKSELDARHQGLVGLGDGVLGRRPRPSSPGPWSALCVTMDSPQ